MYSVMNLMIPSTVPNTKPLRNEISLQIHIANCLNKVSSVYVSSCTNTGSIRDDLYWTSRKNSLELIELSSIKKVSLV